MPAENEFEKSMQQLLGGLRVEPAPSDWQAVHEKLHPQKKRRIIWWWLPILASLVVAGLWMRNDPTGSGQARMVLSDKNTMATQSEIGGNKERPLAENNLPNTVNEWQTAPANKTTIAGIDKEASAILTRQHSATEQQSASEPAREFATLTRKPNNQQDTAKANQHNDNTKSTVAAIEAGGTTTVAIRESNTRQEISTNTITDSVKEASTAALVVGTSPIASNKASSHPDTPVSVLPNPKTPSKWNWLVYGGVGINITGEAVNMKKSAADYATGGSGGSILVAQNEIGNGFHAAAGALVENHWSKNWKLQMGIGLSYGTWSGNSEIFRDSVNANSSFYSRTQVSDQHSNYKLLLAELPLQIHNRFAGSKSTTWWWTAGINNQFLLGLNEHTTRQNFNQNFSTVSDEKSLTSTANFYQPQIRLGFMLDHVGAKAHWQLQPLFNYSLVPVYKSSSDNQNLLNLQLQYRLYLGKL